MTTSFPFTISQKRDQPRSPARLRLLPLLIGVVVVMVLLRAGGLIDGVSRATAAAKSAEKAVADAPPVTPGKPADTHGERPEQQASMPMQTGPTTGEQDSKPFQLDDGHSPQLTSAEEIRLFQKLTERREALRARARDLDLREKVVAVSEQRLARKLKQANKLRDEIKALLGQHDTARDAKMKNLVKIYESMKPKDAARIFEQLDIAVLLNVVERMRVAKSAPVIAALSPAKAEEITTALANRGALPEEKVVPDEKTVARQK